MFGGHDVEPDDRRQHDEAAEEAVEQELHCGVLTLWAAVGPDDEVHRDQDGFEEDVEEEDVERDEDAHHAALQSEDQGEIAADRAFACRGDIVDLISTRR